MQQGFSTEHIAHINPRDLPRLDAVLNQESGEGSLNQSVLIPIRMGLDELHHGLLKRCWQLALKTHDGVAA